jgi:hypothetical protein
MPRRRREQLDLGSRLLQFDEHTVRRRRMDEGHERPFRAGAGFLVDQPDAARPQVREGRFDIVDAERHMMHAGATLLDELRDWRIGGCRLEHLERRLSGVQECRADPLRPDLLAGLDVEDRARP